MINDTVEHIPIMQPFLWVFNSLKLYTMTVQQLPLDSGKQESRFWHLRPHACTARLCSKDIFAHAKNRK